MKIIDDGILNKEQYDKLSIEEKFGYWMVNGNKFVPLEKLTDEYIQNAYCFAQKKQLDFHNRLNFFTGIIEKMEEVAEKKGLILNDLPTNFHKNQRKFKKKKDGIRT